MSFWGGNAGREGLRFQPVVTSGSHAGQTIGSLFNLVNVMTYDAGYQNYDAVTAFMEYKLLESSNIPVGIGLEIPTEAWGGATLVLNNSDAGAAGTIVVENQYNVVLNQPYSIQQLVGSVQANTRNANPHDGAMIWDILKTTSPTDARTPSVWRTTSATSLAGRRPRPSCEVSEIVTGFFHTKIAKGTKAWRMKPRITPMHTDGSSVFKTLDRSS